MRFVIFANLVALFRRAKLFKQLGKPRINCRLRGANVVAAIAGLKLTA